MSKCLNVIHISDLHFHVNELAPENHGAEICLKNLGGIGASNNSLNEANSAVIITGDLTESGITTEYSKLGKALRHLTSNHIFFAAVPGNHDYELFNKGADNLPDCSARHKKAFIPENNGYEKLGFSFEQAHESFYPLYFKLRGHHFIGLNSIEDVSAYDITPSGKFGMEQLGRLKTLLDKLQNRGQGEKVIVFTHHHPFPLPFGGDKDPDSTHSMQDWRAFNDLIGSYSGRLPPADVLLFGHVHMQMPFIKGSNLQKFLTRSNFGCAKIPLILSAGKTPLISQAVDDINDRDMPVSNEEEKRSALLLHFCKDKGFVPEVFKLDLSRSVQDQLPSLKHCSLSHI